MDLSICINALDSSCIFGLLTSRQNVRLEMEKTNQKSNFLGLTIQYGSQDTAYIQNLYYISKYTNGHGL